MSRRFVLRIDDEHVDIGQTFPLNELQDYEIVIDPLEKEIKVQLFIGEEELSVEQIFKEEKPYYKFRAKHKFENIGIQQLRVKVDGDEFTQEVRVKPKKISQEEYEKILDQIRKTAYNIIFEIFGKSEEEIRLLRLQDHKSPIEFFNYFEKNFEDFKSIFRKIEKDPNVAVKERPRQLNFFETEYFEDIIEYEKPEGRICALQDRLRGLIPKLVDTSEGFLSYDVYENRLLKYFLGLALNKLSYLEEIALNEKEREKENQAVFGGDPVSDARFQKRIDKWNEIVEKCRKYRKNVNWMRNKAFLEEAKKVGLIKTSMVLQKEPRYKAFYKLYQDFRKNSIIEVHSKYFHIPVMEVWRIYEIWVLLKVFEALQKIGFELSKQEIIDVDTRYIHEAKKVRFIFDVTKNRPLLELKRDDNIAKLYYQRAYSVGFSDYGSVDEYSQIPDIVIEIFEKRVKVPKVIIFDPKYRIDADKPPESAKKGLSHYKNTIRDIYDQRIVRYAYIVYPGEFTKSFGKHKDFGYIGLKPYIDVEGFNQKISEMVDHVLSR